MESSSLSSRDSIIKVITSPLGFFALSLLILEGFLAIVVVGSRTPLPPYIINLGMWMATLSFAGIVSIVSLMVWKIPKNLTFKSEDWVENSKNEKIWGTKKNPVKFKELSDEKEEQPIARPE